MDNGGDELITALQAEITPLRTKYSRASKSQRTSSFCAAQRVASVQSLDAVQTLE